MDQENSYIAMEPLYKWILSIINLMVLQSKLIIIRINFNDGGYYEGEVI